ncbi:hypothetical protein EYF80_030826 [Liparis tanakae]|uniref:Uncharacterized protein n=1 Tax=Liparis tanakae TaxID=230148 RepID=A0A4Z2H1F3_9TELE|nr:hypothetical protein EYF80_030826 [Liparis tanakae]
MSTGLCPPGRHAGLINPQRSGSPWKLLGFSGPEWSQCDLPTSTATATTASSSSSASSSSFSSLLHQPLPLAANHSTTTTTRHPAADKCRIGKLSFTNKRLSLPARVVFATIGAAKKELMDLVHQRPEQRPTPSRSETPTASHSRSRSVGTGSADQSGRTPSVVRRQLLLINPGDPGLLAASPQHVPPCLHTLISFVSVQNVPRTVISESMRPPVPSFILPVPPSQKREILLESVREIRGSESANSRANRLS